MSADKTCKEGTPLFKPADCPGKIMKYLDERAKKRDDKLFGKLTAIHLDIHEVKTTGLNHQVWLYSLSVFLLIFFFLFLNTCAF